MKESWYLTGLTDGEGCFCVSFNLRARLKLGIEVRPSFSITLNKRDHGLLKRVYDYFHIGGIRFSKKDQCYKYEVRDIKNLVKVVIPHFETYPLKSSKKKDFDKFVKICKLIHVNKHRSKEGLIKIIELAFEMNPSGTRKLDKSKLLKQLAR
ncbi:MAG TPA: endonuclease [Spirochaetes bacterium]|nr:endonuclease [Spirochaetota bacterium]